MLVKFAYICFFAIGALLAGSALATTLEGGYPGEVIFLLAFGGLVLLAIGVAELFHPEDKQYLWGDHVPEDA